MPKLVPPEWDPTPDLPGDEVEQAVRPTPIHFESLTNSAFDFFQKAFAEVGTEPKYSVIHFYTGAELIFKARLLHEHWALVVTKVEEASLAKFKSGNFKSVTLQQAANRLRDIADESFTKDERECFEKLGQHRNRIVHFFHEEYAAEPKPEIVGEVAAEQFRAWIYLHRLLTDRWSELFEPFLERIEDLDARIKRNAQFLSAKFALVQPELAKRQAAGISIVVCPSCGLRSASLDQRAPPLRQTLCLVCGHAHGSIIMNCENCNAEVEFEEGEGTCSECETDYDLDDLLKQFSPGFDPREESDTAYCSECERTDHQTVVPYEDEYICLNCGSTFRSIGQCGYCSEHIAGDLEDSYLIGCMFCGGRIGDDRD